jgi:hypothetical protein
MKANKEELINVLYPAIERSRRNNEVKDVNYLKDKLAEHNIGIGKVQGIYDTNIPLETLSNADLYLFTKYLFETTKNETINITNWFYDEEIKTHDQHTEDVFYKDNKIILYDVSQTSEYEYLVSKMTYVEMSNIINQKLLTYNYRTQREARIVYFGNEFIKRPEVKSNKIMDMFEMMKTGFEANLISLNIRKIGTEKFVYDEKKRILIIEVDNDNTFLDIIDGFHRWLAATACIMNNPSNQGYFHAKIYNMTESKAQSYLAREEKASPMNLSHVAGYDNRDAYVTFTKDINSYGENRKSNELFGMIALDDIEYLSQNKYTTVEVFSKGLKHNFKFKDMNARELGKLQDFFVKYFNELLGILQEKYSGENSVIFEKKIFIGYIALGSKLINKNDWKLLLEQALSSIDFSRSSDWENIGLFKDDVNNSNVKLISNYFKKEVGVD